MPVWLIKVIIDLILMFIRNNKGKQKGLLENAGRGICKINNKPWNKTCDKLMDNVFGKE